MKYRLMVFAEFVLVTVFIVSLGLMFAERFELMPRWLLNHNQAILIPGCSIILAYRLSQETGREMIQSEVGGKNHE